MRFPLNVYGEMSDSTTLLAAFAIGIGFGFFLERAGFGSARKLAAQFYFRDFAVLKVMFTAIVVAGTGFWWMTSAGALDLSSVYINPTILGAQIVGGLILGIGFVIGGYCPGTSCVAMATGKTDSYWYGGGILFGMLVYSFVEPAVTSACAGGSMGEAFVWQWLGVSPGLVLLIAVLIAVGAFTLGTIVESKKRTVVSADSSAN